MNLRLLTFGFVVWVGAPRLTVGQLDHLSANAKQYLLPKIRAELPVLLARLESGCDAVAISL
jgi:hypothetical protein